MDPNAERHFYHNFPQINLLIFKYNFLILIVTVKFPIVS